MSETLDIALRISLQNTDLVRGMRGSTKSLKKFSETTQREFRSIRDSASRLTRSIAALGVSLSATMVIANSAKLDKQLAKIGQTAGVGQRNTEGLRNSLFRLARETGQPLNSLISGFDDLIQAGQTWQEALATIKAINPAMAVTGAQAKTLARGMTVAAQAFKFDLTQPQIAVRILDQMTVAGRLGNAELEDLSGVFC